MTESELTFQCQAHTHKHMINMKKWMNDPLILQCNLLFHRLQLKRPELISKKKKERAYIETDVNDA